MTDPKIDDEKPNLFHRTRRPEPTVPVSPDRPPTNGEVVVRLVLGVLSILAFTAFFLANCTPLGAGFAAYLRSRP